MKNIIKIITFGATIALFSCCTSSDKVYDNAPAEITTYEIPVTKTVASYNALATATPVTINTEDVIEAFVTSNDAAGNFYKSISFQTIPTDASAPIGFSVSVDKSMLFLKGFTPGRKVFIKLNGLAYAKVYGSMQIGVADPAQSSGLTGISEFEVQNHLFPSSTIVDENTFVRTMPLSQALLNSNLNTLIEITNTQFADNSIARTFFDVDNGGYATNHELVDVTIGDITPSVKKYCRISKYAPFSINNVPAERGNIRGVMTKYNSDFQFLVRSISDFKLTTPRAYVFNSTLNETFTTAVNNQVYFPNYLNFATLGTKKWFIKAGALEMSSFGGAVERNRSYFLVPVDFSAASTFTFQIKAGFYTNGLGLKVYHTTDYVPGMKISAANLYDITTSFGSLPTSSTTSYSTAGTYSIPSNLTGNGYFVFEYTGTNISTGPPVTTTVDIDNIVIN